MEDLQFVITAGYEVGDTPAIVILWHAPDSTPARLVLAPQTAARLVRSLQGALAVLEADQSAKRTMRALALGNDR